MESSQHIHIYQFFQGWWWWYQGDDFNLSSPEFRGKFQYQNPKVTSRKEEKKHNRALCFIIYHPVTLFHWQVATGETKQDNNENDTCT